MVWRIWVTWQKMARNTNDSDHYIWLGIGNVTQTTGIHCNPHQLRCCSYSRLPALLWWQQSHPSLSMFTFRVEIERDFVTSAEGFHYFPATPRRGNWELSCPRHGLTYNCISASASSNYPTYISGIYPEAYAVYWTKYVWTATIPCHVRLVHHSVMNGSKGICVLWVRVKLLSLKYFDELPSKCLQIMFILW